MKLLNLKKIIIGAVLMLSASSVQAITLSPNPYIYGSGATFVSGCDVNDDSHQFMYPSGGISPIIGDGGNCPSLNEELTNLLNTPGIADAQKPINIYFFEFLDPSSGDCLNLTPQECLSANYPGMVDYEILTIISQAQSEQSNPVLNNARYGYINVVKTVINDNGGTKTVADFPLFVNGVAVISGDSNIFPGSVGLYTITETSDPKYTQSFSGDCDSNGKVDLYPGNSVFCIITNDDIGIPVVIPPIPPLIDVLKVPNPLALPAGPGPVTYSYTLRNIGTVAVSNITMVGDTCSPIVLVSGDINSNAKLDLNETWTHRCTTNLSETHTNTVVATGWANGISAVDIASSTVIVGVPILPDTGIIKVAPPLIHVVKIPRPLALLAGGGTVVYTEIVSNPGLVPLSKIRLTDDKCGPMKFISGDKNRNSILETTEKWTYICQTNVIKTTTNTATVEGSANGLTVKDLAVSTVVVAEVIPENLIPGLPNTGDQVVIDSKANSDINILFNLILAVSVVGAIILLVLIKLKKLN